MRLALALQTLVGLALLVVTLAGVDALLRSGPVFGYPWPPLSSLRLVLLLGLLSGCWLLTNGPSEGRTLYEVSKSHGITAADLLVVPPLLVAAALVLRAVLART